MTNGEERTVVLPLSSHESWFMPPPNPWLSHRGDRLTRAEKIAAKPEFASIIDQDMRDYLAECRKADPPIIIKESEWKLRLQNFRFAVGDFLSQAVFPVLFVALLCTAAYFVLENNSLREERRDDVAFRRDIYLYSQALVQQTRQMRANPSAAPPAPEPPGLIDGLTRIRERNEALRQQALERRAAAAPADPAAPAVVGGAAEAPVQSAQPTP